MKSKDWIIFASILVVGIIIHTISKLEVPFWLSHAIGRYSGNAIVYSEEKTIHIESKCIIEIIDNIGDITIKGDEQKDKIDIKWSKMFFDVSKSNAEKLDKEVMIHIQQTPGIIKIASNSYEVEKKYNVAIKNAYEITAPKECMLHITNKNGKVLINDFNNVVNLENKYGDIKIENISADINVRHFFGSTWINNIGGGVYIYNEYSNLEVSNVRKLVKVESKYAKMRINDLQSDFISKSKFGIIQAKAIDGNVDIEARHIEIDLSRIKNITKIDASFSKIKIEDVKSDVQIDSKHSPIEVRNVAGKVLIKATHKEIELGDIYGWCKIEAEHCYINARNLYAGISINNSFEDVLLEDVKGVSNIENHHSDVTIKFNDLNFFQYDIQAKYGDIKFIFTDDINFSMEGYAYRGEVKSEFSKEFLIVEKSDDSYKFYSSVSGSNKFIKVKSYYGDIFIEKKSKRIAWLENEIMSIHKNVKNNIDKAHSYMQESILIKILIFFFKLKAIIYPS
jgi:hypothetical protein